MICPQSARVVTRKDHFFKWVKEKVGTKTQQEEVLIPQPHTMRQMCMEYYLIPSRDIFINGEFYKTYDISKATDGLLKLYESCYNQKVIQQGRSSYNVVTMGSLKEVSPWHVGFLAFCYDKDKFYV